MLTDGALTPFFTRPVSLILVALTVLTVLLGIRPVAAALGRGWERLKRAGGRARG